MTFKDYQNLTPVDQELVCWHCGVCIAKRYAHGYIFHLYQVSGFYIEVQYSVAFNVIVCFNAFETTDLLDPYLQDIEVKILLFHRP